MSTENRNDQQDEVGVIKLKLMVDKVRNRVVFAEVDHEFMDILLSFLTLPLGTILKLLGEDDFHMGSINRIYASVSSMDPKYFCTPMCKTMLLSPKNAVEVQCKKLKINLDPFPELAGKFYECRYYHCPGKLILLIYPWTHCQHCSEKIVEKKVEEEKSRSGDGVFVKEGSTFMVTDDLRIYSYSTATVIALFKKLGIDNSNEFEERTVEIGRDKVLQLLKFSLSSKSAFTNAFLVMKGIIDPVHFEFKEAAKSEDKTPAQNSSMAMKLIVNTSTGRVLYAEAGVDVVDLLFSFLTFPLGAVIKLADESSKLGCIDNLYKDAQELSTTNYVKSDESKGMLISPKLHPHFGYENHPLQMNDYPQVVFDSGRNLRFRNLEQGVSMTDASEQTSFLAKIIDPKSPIGETNSGKGYMKEPTKFMITNMLVVTPLSPIMCIFQLNELNVDMNDVEERVVTMGKEEALHLLRASLISTSVLNDVFSPGGSVSVVTAKSKTTYGTMHK